MSVNMFGPRAELMPPANVVICGVRAGEHEHQPMIKNHKSGHARVADLHASSHSRGMLELRIKIFLADMNVYLHATKRIHVAMCLCIHFI